MDEHIDFKIMLVIEPLKKRIEELEKIIRDYKDEGEEEITEEIIEDNEDEEEE